MKRFPSRLLPFFAGFVVLLLSGCSVIQTITGTSPAQDTTSDTEIVIVTEDALSNSDAAAMATATPVTPAEERDDGAEDGSPSPTPLNEGISPTTGRPLPQGAVYRPVLVAIDNAAQARPQTALMLADIVYEFPLDRTDHVTRYLALFSDELPTRVGPVRSSRSYLAETAEEWGGLYVSLGDPEIAAENYPLLKDSSVRFHVENTGDAAQYFYQDKTITAIKEHTSFFQLLPYVEDNYHFTVAYSDQRFAFEHGVTYEKGKEVLSVGIPFTSSDSERVLFTYDKAKNVLVRSDKNSKKVLGESKSLTPTDDALGYANELITVQNLIVQYVHTTVFDSNFRNIMVTGKGDCMYFINGRAVFGSWSRPQLSDPTTYTLYDGTIVRLEPGNTWIMMMPSTRQIKTLYVG
ncbi:MAG: DUF3048 domain-containing protein [Eubacteriales bacterium]|nr:DUF3048 domain-containing protein [Eubacteriales bacterium]